MIPPVNSINFKGKYLVQVPKTAFEEPKDARKCDTEFEERFSNVLYEDKTKGQINKMPFLSFLEAPIYCDVVGHSKYPLSWVRAHTGIDVKDPKDPNYHSFVVITKNEASDMIKKTKPWRIWPAERIIDKEIRQREDEGLCTDQTWVDARSYVLFNGILDDCTKNSGPDEVIILNNLDEIPYAIGEMEF